MVVVVAVASALLVVVVVASDVVDIAAATVGFGRSSAIVSIFAGQASELVLDSIAWLVKFQKLLL